MKSIAQNLLLTFLIPLLFADYAFCQPATAVNDSITLNTNESIEFQVLNNDIGEGIAISRFVQTKYGAVVVNPAENTFTYTPNFGYYGTDAFVYKITDVNGQSSTASVILTVLPNGTAPFAIHADHSCTQYDYTLYANITGGTAPYTISGTVTETIPEENTFTLTLSHIESYNLTFTDATGTSFTLNNSNDVQPCMWFNVYDID